MKKVIFTISFLSAVVFSSSIFSQACSSGSNPNACSPLGGPPAGGFEDPGTTQCVTQGVAYNYSIQFTMFAIFNYLGTQNVDSIQFTSIDNLPCGLCWGVNQTDKTYAANEDGCINIKGTTTDAAGQYKLAVALKAWINGGATGLPIPASLFDQTGTKILLRVKTSAGTCVVADTSANANNLQASLNCPVGINDIAGNISAVNLVPNPMSSISTLSFVSEKTALYAVRISDVAGRVVSSKEVEAKQGANSVTIERNQLSAGVYFLSLTDGKNAVTNRFSITD